MFRFTANMIFSTFKTTVYASVHADFGRYADYALNACLSAQMEQERQ